MLAVRNRRRLISHLAIAPRTALALAGSGALIALNWLIFVHAVNTDRVLETSLGYFITPLVSMVLGMLVLGERVRPLQALALLMAGGGTIYLTLMAGWLPLIAIGLALSFGFYGLIRKLIDVGPMVGLFWETLMMSPLALCWIGWLWYTGAASFGAETGLLSVWLLLTGFVTVVPLVLFARAARGIALITLGILQYLAPSISFCLAVFLFQEPFTADHAIAFGMIWLALALYSAAGLEWMRRMRPVG